MSRRNKIKGLMLIVILALISVFAVACNNKSVESITITGLPENNIATITDTNNTLQLGITSGNEGVQWKSGDEDVATIDESGKITLIDSGAVVITATLKSNSQIKAEALITVKDERTITDTIILSGMPETNMAEYTDGSLQLSAECSNASAILVWVSSDETVATVDSNGLVSFTGGGSTDITVYKKGQRAVKATATLRVVLNVESITINDVGGEEIVAGYDYRLNEPYSYSLGVEYYPWNADDFELEWSIDNTSVAEIDKNGVLTGKGSGKVTVTAKVKGSDVQAEKEFNVVKVNDKAEDFSYAVANRYFVNGVCTDAWLDYTGPKVTTHNTDIFIDTYDTDKKMLVVEKNTDFKHWSHVCLGSWNLTPGKYVLTVDLEVIEGEFQGRINGAQYKNTPAEYEYGIRSDIIGGLDFGKLSDIEPTGTKYKIAFEINQSYKNFGIELYDDNGTAEPYTLYIKSFSLDLVDFAVETDIYSDGVLIMGKTYKFFPGEIEGCEYQYQFTGNGTSNNEIIELKNGILTPKRVGDGVKLTVSTVYNGKTLSKEYNLSVIADPFTENEDDYSYAIDVAQRGELVYDVRRTSVYLRTFNWKASIEEYNGGKTLKFTHDYIASWEGSVQFMLGDIKKGTYSVSFTLHGDDIGKWEKFQGQIYPITWNADYETTFSAEAYTRGQTPYGNIFDTNCVKQGNTYTYTITLTEDINNFGIELCGGTTVDYTVYLDAFKFEKLPAVTGVEIQTDLKTTIKTGEQANLNVSVTYEGGASKGQEYTAEWETSGEGTVRIAEDGTLTAVAPGSVTIELNVVCADGKTFQKTLTVTVEVGEISIETDMYDDGLLVKGEEYSFIPEKFTDESVFEYSYSADGIVKVENGKLTALKAGDVTLTVTETVTGATKEFKLQVVDFSGNKDEDYRYAVNPTQHGDFFDIERTNVYLRTFNMNISVNENKLTLTKNYVPASGASVFFYLGNVEAGRYRLTVELGGDLTWDCFKGYLYALNWEAGWQTTFSDQVYKKGESPYGNIHEPGFCLYSGSGNSTTGGTYTMYIDIASAQTDFGLMLETWGTENKSFTIILESFAFEREDLTKQMNFDGAAIYNYSIDNYGSGITVVGKDGSMVVTKAATSAAVSQEDNALQVVTPTNWSEIALCFGTVKAGAYLLELKIEAVDMTGNYWFSGIVYSGTCVNGKITYDGTIGLISENAAEVTHVSNSKTVQLQIEVTEDIENFALILASKGDCGQAVNIQLSDISLQAQVSEV